MRRHRPGLIVLLLVYGLASFLHHVHNAVFLDEYPNLPAWLSEVVVYAAWLGVTLVGLAGYLLLRKAEIAGLTLIAVYGALGLDGLAHYGRAPLAAHTLTMNLSILFEVMTGALLLITAVALIMKRVLPALSQPRSGA